MLVRILLFLMLANKEFAATRVGTYRIILRVGFCALFERGRVKSISPLVALPKKGTTHHAQAKRSKGGSYY